jgi:hypothetical protein
MSLRAFCHSPSISKQRIGDVISREHNFWSQPDWFYINMVVEPQTVKMKTLLHLQRRLLQKFGIRESIKMSGFDAGHGNL